MTTSTSALQCALAIAFAVSAYVLAESVTGIPTYMEDLMNDLAARNKLFDETPPEEVKYWFEYTGPLQKYFYRFSKKRGKADYFEGRDDSGVVSSRFVENPGGTEEYQKFFLDQDFSKVPTHELPAYKKLLDYCTAMGANTRPDTNEPIWQQWFGDASPFPSADRCRILFVMNTVGAGRLTTMLWETSPPPLHAELPQPWTSEQETAVTHIQRNLQEIDAMCQTGLIAAKLQVMVCEPIPAVWTEWIDAQLPHCGGKEQTIQERLSPQPPENVQVEDRPSPVQIVVAASAATADTCHNLKSGFMEKRTQDIVLAPPFLELNDAHKKSFKSKIRDPTIKTTHPDLFSSDDHDMYVAFKWSSLITIRAVHSFLQASADIAAAASSTAAFKDNQDTNVKTPSSPFLIPSFVRVSYVSEENTKVAKWRMHGDFFHPAAWEINKDSFDMTFIPHSLSASNEIKTICNEQTATGRKLASTEECGQWWVYMTELQMPISPEIYANEVAPPPVQGGSNYIWMLTERQRREIVKALDCLHLSQLEDAEEATCPDLPQAVIPLGDLESFLINFVTNNALGKQHVTGRAPGYSREAERAEERKRVHERKQLNGQKEIEDALFDYTVYPAALFHKDATIKAARARDFALTTNRDENIKGPQTVKSSYYDVTIIKPRPPLLGWCQAIARRGLCTLFSDYFRLSNDDRCFEACGMSKNWTPIG